jgi:hypothetical protein
VTGIEAGLVVCRKIERAGGIREGRDEGRKRRGGRGGTDEGREKYIEQRETKDEEEGLNNGSGACCAGLSKVMRWRRRRGEGG